VIKWGGHRGLGLRSSTPSPSYICLRLRNCRLPLL